MWPAARIASQIPLPKILLEYFSQLRDLLRGDAERLSFAIRLKRDLRNWTEPPQTDKRRQDRDGARARTYCD